MSFMPTGSPRSGIDARRVGGAARAFDVERGEGADLVLARGDRLRAHVDDGARRQFAGLDPAGKIERGEHQAVRSRRATMRSVRRRQVGMIMNAVPAATGQAMT